MSSSPVRPSLSTTTSFSCNRFNFSQEAQAQKVIVLICEGESRSLAKLCKKYAGNAWDVSLIKISRLKIRDYFLENQVFLKPATSFIVCSGETTTKKYPFRTFFQKYIIPPIIEHSLGPSSSENSLPFTGTAFDSGSTESTLLPELNDSHIPSPNCPICELEKNSPNTFDSPRGPSSFDKLEKISLSESDFDRSTSGLLSVPGSKPLSSDIARIKQKEYNPSGLADRNSISSSSETSFAQSSTASIPDLTKPEAPIPYKRYSPYSNVSLSKKKSRLDRDFEKYIRSLNRFINYHFLPQFHSVDRSIPAKTLYHQYRYWALEQKVGRFEFFDFKNVIMELIPGITISENRKIFYLPIA